MSIRATRSSHRDGRRTSTSGFAWSIVHQWDGFTGGVVAISSTMIIARTLATGVGTGAAADSGGRGDVGAAVRAAGAERAGCARQVTGPPGGP